MTAPHLLASLDPRRRCQHTGGNAASLIQLLEPYRGQVSGCGQAVDNAVVAAAAAFVWSKAIAAELEYPILQQPQVVGGKAASPIDCRLDLHQRRGRLPPDGCSLGKLDHRVEVGIIQHADQASRHTHE
ncbi:hypothetical protein ABZX92_40940 [Lentzea sp. NPDC006480]|uniref:hypothetical protein n=1 Tax=Lentzea sp. NPDC006480 TaxID=3157176 RepID=UPI0033AFB184